MEPIKSYDEFFAMQKYFLDRNKIRDWTIWTVGISFGFRISDLLNLKFGHILNPDGTFRSRTYVLEQKTNKLNGFIITESIIDAFSKYFDSLNWTFNLEDYIFTSQKKCKMATQSAWQIISDAAREVIPGGEIGTHTLRKSHAGIMLCLLKTSIDVNTVTAIQMTLNHSDPKTTMRYLGVANKILDRGRELVSDFVLGKSGINELTIGTSTTTDDIMDKLDKIGEQLSLKTK
jgi:integrase